MNIQTVIARTHEIKKILESVETLKSHLDNENIKYPRNYIDMLTSQFNNELKDIGNDIDRYIKSLGNVESEKIRKKDKISQEKN